MFVSEGSRWWEIRHRANILERRRRDTDGWMTLKKWWKQMKLWIENRQVRFKREEREYNSRMLEKWELKVETREKGKKN